MKRYRVFSTDFDTRATLLALQIKSDWDCAVQELHDQNKQQVLQSVLHDYGYANAKHKVDNLLAIGPRPFSVVAYHNVFFAQVRDSFVCGNYFPAATGATALGERILNHLVLRLRGSYKTSGWYKKVYQKDSFDNWQVPIDALVDWGVLLEAAADGFRELKEIRTKTIHFRQEFESHAREWALEAVNALCGIIKTQFTALWGPPWLIEGTKGACFIAKDWEKNPFVELVYLPNCFHVGPYHLLDSTEGKWFVSADPADGMGERTDAEFADAFNNRDAKMRELGLVD